MRSENFLLVSLAAEKFGTRPSELVGLLDPLLALDFDLAATARLLEAERAACAEAESGLGAASPPARRTRQVNW